MSLIRVGVVYLSSNDGDHPPLRRPDLSSTVLSGNVDLQHILFYRIGLYHCNQLAWIFLADAPDPRHCLIILP
jgi:hypothetical protein